jgi:hypothetical protein
MSSGGRLKQQQVTGITAHSPQLRPACIRHITGEAGGAVVLLTVKRLSILACAWRQQRVAEEVLEFSQGFPGWR